MRTVGLTVVEHSYSILLGFGIVIWNNIFTWIYLKIRQRKDDTKNQPRNDDDDFKRSQDLWASSKIDTDYNDSIPPN